MVPKKRIQDQAASAPPLSLQQHRAGDSWYEIRTEGQRTRDESQLVHTELIALLYQHTPAAILGTSMAVLMTWVVIWGMVPPRVLLMWTAVMAAVLLWRYAMYLRFQNASESWRQSLDWEKLATLGAGITGLCLGVGGVVIASHIPPFYQGGILLMVLGMVVSAIPFLGAVRIAYFSYSVSAALPISIWCAQQSNILYISTAVMMGVFICAAWVTSTMYCHSIESVIRARNKLSEVTSAKNALQDSYDKLAREQRYRAVLEERIVYQASHDPLTGFFNRYEFERCLQRAIDSARDKGVEHALYYLDLDRFKVVNDSCGHAAGDELLRQFGNLLRGQIRAHVSLARLGGDEFGMVMENCTMQEASCVADKVCRAVADFHFVWEKQIFRIGVSIGLIPITVTSESITKLLIAADGACYAAKNRGRNHVHVHQTNNIDLSLRQREMQ